MTKTKFYLLLGLAGFVLGLLFACSLPYFLEKQAEFEDYQQAKYECYASGLGEECNF